MQNYDEVSSEEELPNMGTPQYELPKSLWGSSKIGNYVTIKWNKADTQSGFLKHQIDSLDYW